MNQAFPRRFSSTIRRRRDRRGGEPRDPARRCAPVRGPPACLIEAAIAERSTSSRFISAREPRELEERFHRAPCAAAARILRTWSRPASPRRGRTVEGGGSRRRSGRGLTGRGDGGREGFEFAVGGGEPAVRSVTRRSSSAFRRRVAASARRRSASSLPRRRSTDHGGEDHHRCDDEGRDENSARTRRHCGRRENAGRGRRWRRKEAAGRALTSSAWTTSIRPRPVGPAGWRPRSGRRRSTCEPPSESCAATGPRADAVNVAGQRHEGDHEAAMADASQALPAARSAFRRARGEASRTKLRAVGGHAVGVIWKRIAGDVDGISSMPRLAPVANSRSVRADGARRGRGRARCGSLPSRDRRHRQQGQCRAFEQDRQRRVGLHRREPRQNALQGIDVEDPPGHAEQARRAATQRPIVRGPGAAGHGTSILLYRSRVDHRVIFAASIRGPPFEETLAGDRLKPCPEA